MESPERPSCPSRPLAAPAPAARPAAARPARTAPLFPGPLSACSNRPAPRAALRARDRSASPSALTAPLQPLPPVPPSDQIGIGPGGLGRGQGVVRKVRRGVAYRRQGREELRDQEREWL